MSIMTWMVTPRRAASARMRPSWCSAPSTRTTQVRRWQRVAGLGLVERGGDHVRGVLADGPGQPLGQGLRPGPERAGAGRPPGGAITSCGRRLAGSAS